MLNKSRRHFRRYEEIAKALARHGWGWTLERLGLAHHAGTEKSAGRAQDSAAHLREMLSDLGVTFVKLGQILSTRPDIVPEAYIKELSKLQDTAPALPPEQARKVVEEEFGASIEDLYRNFQPTPLAAASLAQVHAAELPEGTPVIIKVQRPGIQEQVETDLEILHRRARFLEGHWEKARIYGLMDIVDEFALTIREELDFNREARNTERLREMLTAYSGVKVPQVYWSLTTGKVLTLERMSGVKITELPSHPLPAVNQVEVARRLANAFFGQVLINGFFHADPHPGNVLVSEQGEIQLVDCGEVGRLDAEVRAGVVRMLLAFEHRDSRALAEEIVNTGAAQEEVNLPRLTLDMGRAMRSYYDAPARAVHVGELLTRLLRVSADHRIRMPASFALLTKVFSNIEGICRQLDPDFNFTEVLRPYVAKALKSELHPPDTLTELYWALAEMRSFLVSLPENLTRLMRKAVEGRLRVEFKHQGLEEVSASFQAVANRVSIALIVGATIVGSSLLVLSGRGRSSVFGIPELGALGYLVAMIFGVWLVFGILRSGRRRKR